MGVQHLWNILEPSKRVESITKLRGKTLCVDLSLWICEAQGTKGLKDQLKPYLRTVFFRTMYLTSIGVRPVFVIDGIPPEIKRETIVKRLQGRGFSGKSSLGSKKLKRSKFNIWCDECCEMFRLLGVPFVKSEGEAEALCAWLNKNKYVDGVLTDDGDVFLYGAKVVYKDFNISSSKSRVDCLQVYNIDDIESYLGLNQRNLIALGLLLGCDYLPTGVPGVGKETVIKLLSYLSGVDLLQRFHEWKESPDIHPENYENLEVNIKRKAVKIANFPQDAVIKEFLSPKIGQEKIDITWKCPDMVGIKGFFLRKLDWPEDYTEEKMFNLGTDWQLACNEITMFIPIRITKERVKQKVELFEVEWETQNTCMKWPTNFASIKTKEVMRFKHSNIVECFETELAAKKSKTHAKRKAKSKPHLSTTSVDKDEELQNVLSKIENIQLGGDCEEDDDVFVENICTSSVQPSKGLVPILHQGMSNEPIGMFERNTFRPMPTASDSLTSGACTFATTSESKKYSDEKSVSDAHFNTFDTDNDIPSPMTASTKYSLGNNIQVTANQSPVQDLSTSRNTYVFNSDTPNIELSPSSAIGNKNEKTPFNLADITIDQTFEIGSPNIDELLASPSFARIKSLSLSQQNSSFTSLSSYMEMSEDEDHRFCNNQNDRAKSKEWKCDEREKECVTKTENDLNLSCALAGFEETSLSSRLLRRFEIRNNNIAETLKSISSQETCEEKDKENKKTTNMGGEIIDKSSQREITKQVKVVDYVTLE